MVKFQTLSRVKLEKIFSELVHFFYKKAKVNIAVEDAIERPKYKKFYNAAQKTLKKQITPYTKEKRIKEIITKVQKVDNRDIALTIAITFIVFQAAFPTGEKGIKDFLKWAAVIGALDALSKLGVSSPSFDANGDEVQKIIDDRFDFLTAQVDETTMAWIARNIEIGIVQELTAKEIAEMISENMDATIKRRAAIIAEAELVYMIGALTLLVFKKNGVSRVRWITVGDERTCKICMGNESDGWISIGDAFSSGVTAPPSHIACRCYLEPKTKIDGKVWQG